MSGLNRIVANNQLPRLLTGVIVSDYWLISLPVSSSFDMTNHPLTRFSSGNEPQGMFLLWIFPGTIARAFSPPRRLNMAQSPAVRGLCLSFFSGGVILKTNDINRIIYIQCLQHAALNKVDIIIMQGFINYTGSVTAARKYCVPSLLPAVHGILLLSPDLTQQCIAPVPYPSGRYWACRHFALPKGVINRDNY